jgi:hypothetical protein
MFLFDSDPSAVAWSRPDSNADPSIPIHAMQWAVPVLWRWDETTRHAGLFGQGYSCLVPLKKFYLITLNGLDIYIEY